MTPECTILIGDVRSRLAYIEHEIASGRMVRPRTVVTSPPYWGLRAYGTPPQHWPEGSYSPMAGVPPIPFPAWEGELGQEPDPFMFIGHIVEIFRCVRQVLADDGTLWINIGDCHTDSGRGPDVHSTLLGSRQNQAECRKATFRSKFKALGKKQLICQPWRVGLALQADGWFLRQRNHWFKTNPMPESVKDRTTNAHEYVLHFSKRARYFYNASAIMERASPDSHRRRAKPPEPMAFFGDVAQTGQPKNGVNPKANGPNSRMVVDHTPRGRKPNPSVGNVRPKQNASFSAAVSNLVDERNCRNVWPIATEPYEGAHYAVFPPALVRRPILASTEVGDWVLDCFGGSGTVGEVALEYGRNAVLIDLDARNEALMRDRVAAHTGQSILSMSV